MLCVSTLSILQKWIRIFDTVAERSLCVHICIYTYRRITFRLHKTNEDPGECVICPEQYVNFGWEVYTMGIQVFRDSIPWYYIDRKVGSRVYVLIKMILGKLDAQNWWPIRTKSRGWSFQGGCASQEDSMRYYSRPAAAVEFWYILLIFNNPYCMSTFFGRLAVLVDHPPLTGFGIFYMCGPSWEHVARWRDIDEVDRIKSSEKIDVH